MTVKLQDNSDLVESRLFDYRRLWGSLGRTDQLS